VYTHARAGNFPPSDPGKKNYPGKGGPSGHHSIDTLKQTPKPAGTPEQRIPFRALETHPPDIKVVLRWVLTGRER